MKPEDKKGEEKSSGANGVRPNLGAGRGEELGSQLKKKKKK